MGDKEFSKVKVCFIDQYNNLTYLEEKCKYLFIYFINNGIIME